ncbi:hypothetical protein K431DRAFT_12328 [Polychaeton citri CBS 116435]|uniref:Uncharacterized protein n=1 Tax=Polychaeton citri CBS 116435 TaxID=1314669 RepID=A0A9P4Q1F6_9PEZI|nr:hypothetical protein K431DRAFT_12328 [Polychaeton citri CBS 116435]
MAAAGRKAGNGRSAGSSPANAALYLRVRVSTGQRILLLARPLTLIWPCPRFPSPVSSNPLLSCPQSAPVGASHVMRSLAPTPHHTTPHHTTPHHTTTPPHPAIRDPSFPPLETAYPCTSSDSCTSVVRACPWRSPS